MSRIRSKNTKIDLAMREMLGELTDDFTMYPKIEGNPDFAIEKRKVAIFCDGDFWHGYNYKNGKKPKAGYWKDKIENNMRRDQRFSRMLRRRGWSVLRFWEHDILKRPEYCKRKISMSIARRK